MESLKQKERKTQSKLADVYTDVRHAYKSSALFYDYWDNLFVQNLDVKADSTILDLGCGVGHLLKKLHKKGYNSIVGLDITFKMLKKAKGFLGNAADFVLGDAENLPFRDSSLGAVTCCGVLHHIPQIKKAVSEIGRCLKKGGLLLLSETNKSLVLELPRSLLKKSDNFSEAHRALLPTKLKAMLITSKLNVHKQGYFGYLAFALLGFPDILPITSHIPIRVASLLILLDKMFSKIPILRQLSWHTFIIARRVD